MKFLLFKSRAINRRRGVALLIVLVSLAVLTVVIVAFLSNGLSEVKNAKVYSNGTNAKLLSQIAANIVLAEIKDGTSGIDTNNNTLAWTSQPGMIRSYDTTGTLYRYYKLYSSGQMIGPTVPVVSTGANISSGDTVQREVTADNSNMANWYQDPAWYTDLNSPVSVTETNGSGTVNVNHYPILPGDIYGTAMKQFTTLPLSTNNGGLRALSYFTGAASSSTANPPVLDVQGFWIVQPGQSITQGQNLGQTMGEPLAPGASANPIPMPVQWLYVLQNGTVVAPTTGGSTTPPAGGTAGTQATIPGASASNPIVGRIAFWTDDETCKVNINTASEGTFWDTPRLGTRGELDLANTQPVQHEFQRYPGHPAGVSLSTVFGGWLPRPPGGYTGTLTPANSYDGLTSATYTSNLKPYYDLAPKIVAGTGEPVSTTTINATTAAGNGTYGGTVSETTSQLSSTAPLITTDADHLYDSIDELQFGGVPAVVKGLRSITPLTKQQLEESKFFITAHSRAPDVNVFNQPRVCVWPEANVDLGAGVASLSSPGLYRSALDQLIAFCTTIGGYNLSANNEGNIYFFQRIPNDSGSSGTPGWNDPYLDISLARNQQLLTYLRGFCGLPFPGYSGGTNGTFANKYKATNNDQQSTTCTEMNQILTEIFDYIRCTNVYDSSDVAAISGFVPYAANGGNASRAAGGTVCPSLDGDPQNKGAQITVPFYGTKTGKTQTKGFGRFVTVSQAALVFTEIADENTVNDPTQTTTPGALPPPAAGNIRVQAELLLNLFSPTATNPGMGLGWASSNSFVYTLSGQDQWTWNTIAAPGGAPMGFLPGGTLTTNGPNNNVVYTAGTLNPLNQMDWPRTAVPGLGATGGFWGLTNMLFGNSYSNLYYANSPPWRNYPVFSATGDFNTPANHGSISFHSQGHPLIVNIYYKNGLFNGTTYNGPYNFIQSVTINFPDYVFPIPPNGVAPVVTLINDAGSSYAATSQLNFASFSVPNNTSHLQSYEADLVSAGPPSHWLTPAAAPATTSVHRYNRGNGFTTLDPYTSSGVGGDPRCLLVINGYDVVRSIQSKSGDIRLTAGRSIVSATSTLFVPHPSYLSSDQMAHSLTEPDGIPYYGATRGVLAPIGVAGTGASNSPYVSQQFYDGTGSTVANAPLGSVSGVNWQHNGTTGLGGDILGTPLSHGDLANHVWATTEPNVTSLTGVTAGSTTGLTTDFKSGFVPGDWDNGMAGLVDGPYINATDEGTLGTSTIGNPYFNPYGHGQTIQTSIYSPNREVPSAGMFGSLSTGVLGEKPWQTLLFHPDPDPTSTANDLALPTNSVNVLTGTPDLNNASRHVGAVSPPDYLLMDLFTMPVVEPYAISEPLSTAGRVNMNYQILPFTYINRDTGIRAALKAERILAIPTQSSTGLSATTAYKTCLSNPSIVLNPNDYRYDINLDQTMEGFQNRFSTFDVFRTPSEICSMDLIPNDTSDVTAAYETMETKTGYWSRHAMTGDNSRERPYADIYPRLTTKSNTFMIHMRVQTLQQTKADLTNQPTVWTEGTDQVTGEYRGSEIVERYVDPNDAKWNTTTYDYANPSYTHPALSTLYKFRIVSTKQFAP